jgi:hypothetical protein
MAAQFPVMVPSSRKFQMGELPTKVYRSMSGAVVRRAFGNRKTNYTLDLEFKNIGDDANINSTNPHAGNVAVILSHYESAHGTFESFNLPSRVFQCMGESTESYINNPTDIAWRYAEAPTVTSVRRGISTVQVKFIGELDA